MKKVLLIVVMLLLVTQVMAATTITPVKKGTLTTVDGKRIQAVDIKYTSTVDIRGFAFDVNINVGSLKNIRDFNVGESNGTVVGGKSGFGIFPSRFRDFVNPVGPNEPNWWNANYNPTPAWNEPGTTNPTTGMGFTKFTVEMGTLYQGDANKPALSGTLFTIDVNDETDPNAIVMSIAANTLRGGIVGSDAAGITDVVYNQLVVMDAVPQGVQVPDLNGMTRTAAVTALTNVGLIKGVEANVAPVSAGQLVRTVIGQKPAAGTIVAPGSAVDFNAVSYPVKDAAPASMYANWVNRGRPQCWAYARQCRGDGEGKKLGTWVGTGDLTMLKSGIGKLDSAITGTMICADYEHKKLGTWVGTGDLTILKRYIGKLDSLVPMCGTIPTPGGFSADPNYWYWCIPSGGAACPAGQYCAPIGVCPNTP